MFSPSSMLSQPKWGWIGVDIGGRAIKVVQLRRESDGLRLASAAVCYSSSELADRLRSAVTLAKPLRGSDAAAVLSMSGCDVSPANDDLKRTTDHCFGSWSAGPSSSYTLSVGAEKVNAAVEGFARIGLECEAVDGPPQAIARALQLTRDARPGQMLAALDWGESTATLVAAVDGEAHYVRRLSTAGFAEVRGQVAGALGLSSSEVEEAFHRYGLVDPESDGDAARLVGDALRSALRPIRQELRRTLEHVRGKLKSSGPERLLLMGTAATVAGVARELGDAVGLPAEPWRSTGIVRDERSPAVPDCLLAQAIALSALAWESDGGGAP